MILGGGLKDEVIGISGRGSRNKMNNGVLVPAYNYRIFAVEQHRQFAKMLKAALGNDDFVLCGDINHSELKKLRAECYADGMLFEAGKDKLEQLLRDVLELLGLDL